MTHNQRKVYDRDMEMITAKLPQIRKARRDVARLLTKYRVTLPQIMGIPEYREDEDERIWKMIEPAYQGAQKKTFTEFYPELARKRKRK